MSYSLPLPPRWRNQWKVKIRDRERVEPPHVTILRGTKSWRFGLREGDFLDAAPPPDEVPAEIVKEILEKLEELVEKWDEIYPENKVSSAEVKND